MTKFMLLMLCFVHFTNFLIHNDICGPFQTFTFIDYNYFMFIKKIQNMQKCIWVKAWSCTPQK